MSQQRPQHRPQSRRLSPRATIVCAAVLCASVLATPRLAHADIGDGLKVGPGRLHLGVEAGGRYDSAAGSGLSSTGQPVTEGDGIALLKGTFLLDVKSDDYKLNFGGSLDWNQYLGLTVGTTDLSFLGANLSGGAQINPNGAFGLDIAEGFTRSDRTANPVFALGVIGLRDSTRVRLHYRPGGGAIEGGLSYEFDANLYTPQGSAPIAAGCTDPSCNPNDAKAFNSTTNTVGIDGKWRFLPKTGLLLDATYGVTSYPNNPTTVTSAGAVAAPNVGGSPLRATLGFGTLFSTRTSFTIKGGYQGIFFSPAAGQTADNLNSFSGLAEFGFRFTDTLQTKIGYMRSYQPVGGPTLYFGDDRGYAEARLDATSVLGFTLLGSADRINFGGGSARLDHAYLVGLRADYAATQWLRVLGNFTYSTRDTIGLQAAQATAGLSYNRVEAGLGVAASL